MKDRDEYYANVVMMLEVAFICFLSFYTVWFGYIFVIFETNWWKFCIQNIFNQELGQPLQEVLCWEPFWIILALILDYVHVSWELFNLSS